MKGGVGTIQRGTEQDRYIDRLRERERERGGGYENKSDGNKKGEKENYFMLSLPILPNGICTNQNLLRTARIL